VAYDGKVVSDEDVGDLVAFLQVLEQVDHLRWNRHVQRGNGLRRNDEFGIDRDRPRDAHPLALAAREFERVTFAYSG
jgi:hypothetical protein